ncbi:MAG: hypothetical protein JRH20_18855, partial [Deltaproteobacteria bacterium]|nr:hypothetical protein [Deltaproteobacteria bacterium]
MQQKTLSAIIALLLATFATGADARGPLVCKGSQNIKLKGQEINAAKDA